MLNQNQEFMQPSRSTETRQKQDMYIIGLQQGAQTNIDTFSSFTASLSVINVKNIQKNYNQGNVCSPVRQHRHK